ncbi:MAG: hypothetical protein VX471_00530 [Acidobacteriota bacterium]|nr:hypothetical protein [Acidobacteriota bacterium]|tara:strand:- start:945 stop:1079 length:135 start_codon:yes stop_codon:yes gene_type:complete
MISRDLVDFVFFPRVRFVLYATLSSVIVLQPGFLYTGLLLLAQQ